MLKKHKCTNCSHIQLEASKKKESQNIFSTDGSVENVPWKTGKRPSFNYHMPKRRMNISLAQNRSAGLCWHHLPLAPIAEITEGLYVRPVHVTLCFSDCWVVKKGTKCVFILNLWILHFIETHNKSIIMIQITDYLRFFHYVFQLFCGLDEGRCGGVGNKLACKGLFL